MSQEKHYRFTARITALGADSTCPDRDDAVDAEVFQGGNQLCDVTLLSPEDGRQGLDTWGDPDHWCSDWNAVKALSQRLGVDPPLLVREIVEMALVDCRQLEKLEGEA